MKVIYKQPSEEHYTFFLTDGKVYEAELYDVYYEKVVEYIIRCDDGVVRGFDTDRFITLEENRNNNLKQIFE